LPRRGRPTRASPAGDQSALLERLAGTHPIQICRHPDALAGTLEAVLRAGPRPQYYALGSDVPALLAAFLVRDAVAQSRPASSS
jgi:hypothetical protein